MNVIPVSEYGAGSTVGAALAVIARCHTSIAAKAAPTSIFFNPRYAAKHSRGIPSSYNLSALRSHTNEAYLYTYVSRPGLVVSPAKAVAA